MVEELNQNHVLSLVGDKQFSNDDSLADIVSDEPKVDRSANRRSTKDKRRTPRKREVNNSAKGAKNRNSGSSVQRSNNQNRASGASKPAKKAPTRTLRKRRSVSVGTSNNIHNSSKNTVNKSPRPGQHSSTLSGKR